MSDATTRYLAAWKEKGITTLFPNTIKIMVGTASCGLASGAASIAQAFKANIAQNNFDAMVTTTGCAGMCFQEPLVDITIPRKGRFVYGRVTPEVVPQMIAALQHGNVPDGALLRYTRHECLINGFVKRYLTIGATKKERDVPIAHAFPFYRRQLRIVTRNCGFIDPENIAEYIAQGGYSALATVLDKKSPQQIIRMVEQSGLRGRGGAGFPTGLKWRLCRERTSKHKYIVCNADEGDPGAYMDRTILESDPHAVIEGMLIAAYAIGATEGYIYIRDEYPRAIACVEKALQQAREAHLLGKHILGSSFSCTLTIVRGAGAFVCGEETALLKSIEGDCGEPNQRPPYPIEVGLWGNPTVINNVETLATIPIIISKGPRWFSSIGTKTNTGTKVFSLVGKVQNIGLVEVPMGTPLRDIVYAIGGGTSNGRSCKAVQTGGPSGGCIPERLFNLPVEYDALAHCGSIMGSGGLIVMDDKTCMVDVACYFMSFLEHESCGKCVPCRIGIRRMREVLESICAGTATVEDLEKLETLAHLVAQASLCGLGRTAPNSVLSGLRYFRDEYMAHVHDKTCPAGVCKNLITYRIAESACTGCGVCKKICPSGAITGPRKKPPQIDIATCIKCGACLDVCPAGAIITI
ncbi:MAG: NADH-quinone oxidoreductase subunit NuoF [Desulfobacterota bacterium]|nr:NADH-quinone oxidoreductase subunit NuoF [Thermodesulfobacteriota bacterium]